MQSCGSQGFNKSYLLLLMRKLLKAMIIIGYLLFGYFWLHAGLNCVTKNVFLKIFTLRNIQVSEFKYSTNSKNPEDYNIKYQYKVGARTYYNSLKANKSSFIKKVGLNNQIEIIYNEQLPFISYIKEWNQFLFYKFTFVLFSFFLGLIFFGHKLLIKDAKNRYLANHSND